VSTPDLPSRFNYLAGANLAAQSAEQISLAAVPIVAVLALGAGPGQIGALATAQTLPFLLLSIPAGLLADRWSRRRLMAWAEALRALSLFALLVALSSGQLSMPLLAVLGFLGAAGTVGFSVGAPALVPALVPPIALGAAGVEDAAEELLLAREDGVDRPHRHFGELRDVLQLGIVEAALGEDLLGGLEDVLAIDVVSRRPCLVLKLAARHGANRISIESN